MLKTIPKSRFLYLLHILLSSIQSQITSCLVFYLGSLSNSPLQTLFQSPAPLLLILPLPLDPCSNFLGILFHLTRCLLKPVLFLNFSLETIKIYFFLFSILMVKFSSRSTSQSVNSFNPVLHPSISDLLFIYYLAVLSNSSQISIIFIPGLIHLCICWRVCRWASAAWIWKV